MYKVPVRTNDYTISTGYRAGYIIWHTGFGIVSCFVKYDDWLKEHVKNGYKLYTEFTESIEILKWPGEYEFTEINGIAFESPDEAMLFKLTWL
jgi:hypothetical protein